MKAAVTAIACHLPIATETTEDLARRCPEWQMEKIIAKTGIHCRHLAGREECSSDLGVQAAEKLFATGACRREDIDYLLFCTQTPDYFLPTTACLIQHRLGLPQSTGALDFNLGCSGYVYGLSLAKGLIESGQAHNVLLITAETYSKLARPADRNVRTIFGDAAAATLIRACVDGTGPTNEPLIGPFVLGTDGDGARNLIVRQGGFRHLSQQSTPGASNEMWLEMNGPEIFNFTLRVVPQSMRDLLVKSGRAVDDVDMIIPHQANEYMLEHLRQKVGLPAEKFFVGMRECGNTVSASIPLALQYAEAAGRLQAGALVMLVGFGVGYSWGACFIRWQGGRQ